VTWNIALLGSFCAIFPFLSRALQSSHAFGAAQWAQDVAFALAFYFCAKKVTAYNNSVAAQAFSGVFFFIMS